MVGSLRIDPLVYHDSMGFTTNTGKKNFGRMVCWRRRGQIFPVDRPNAVIPDFQRSRYADLNFIEMGATDITITRFFMDDFQKFLDADESVWIENETKFLWMSFKDISRQFCQLFWRSIFSHRVFETLLDLVKWFC